MRHKKAFDELQKGHYIETEWGTMKVTSPIPKFSPRYEFLKDSDMAQRLIRIKSERQYTNHKIKRKKNDLRLTIIYMIAITLVVGLLLSNQPKIFHAVPAISLGTYVLFTALFIWKVIVPVMGDITYLKHKNEFLGTRQEETMEHLDDVSKNIEKIASDSPKSSHRSTNKRRSGSREEFKM